MKEEGERELLAESTAVETPRAWDEEVGGEAERCGFVLVMTLLGWCGYGTRTFRTEMSSYIEIDGDDRWCFEGEGWEVLGRLGK